MARLCLTRSAPRPSLRIKPSIGILCGVRSALMTASTRPMASSDSEVSNDARSRLRRFLLKIVGTKSSIVFDFLKLFTFTFCYYRKQPKPK